MSGKRDDAPGVYQLSLYLPEETRIAVGKLGTFLFPAGRYIYTGSAMSGLKRRLARHRRQEKTLHWHIDYLLCHARIEEVQVWRTTARVECALNEAALALPGATVIAPRFGASDCRCAAHLVHVPGTRTGGDPVDRVLTEEVLDLMLEHNATDRGESPDP